MADLNHHEDDLDADTPVEPSDGSMDGANDPARTKITAAITASLRSASPPVTTTGLRAKATDKEPSEKTPNSPPAGAAEPQTPETPAAGAGSGAGIPPAAGGPGTTDPDDPEPDPAESPYDPQVAELPLPVPVLDSAARVLPQEPTDFASMMARATAERAGQPPETDHAALGLFNLGVPVGGSDEYFRARTNWQLATFRTGIERSKAASVEQGGWELQEEAQYFTTVETALTAAQEAVTTGTRAEATTALRELQQQAFREIGDYRNGLFWQQPFTTKATSGTERAALRPPLETALRQVGAGLDVAAADGDLIATAAAARQLMTIAEASAIAVDTDDDAHSQCRAMQSRAARLLISQHHLDTLGTLGQLRTDDELSEEWRAARIDVIQQAQRLANAAATLQLGVVTDTELLAAAELEPLITIDDNPPERLDTFVLPQVGWESPTAAGFAADELDDWTLNPYSITVTLASVSLPSDDAEVDLDLAKEIAQAQLAAVGAQLINHQALWRTAERNHDAADDEWTAHQARASHVLLSSQRQLASIAAAVATAENPAALRAALRDAQHTLAGELLPDYGWRLAAAINAKKEHIELREPLGALSDQGLEFTRAQVLSSLRAGIVDPDLSWENLGDFEGLSQRFLDRSPASEAWLWLNVAVEDDSPRAASIVRDMLENPTPTPFPNVTAAFNALENITVDANNPRSLAALATPLEEAARAVHIELQAVVNGVLALDANPTPEQLRRIADHVDATAGISHLIVQQSVEARRTLNSTAGTSTDESLIAQAALEQLGSELDACNRDLLPAIRNLVADVASPSESEVRQLLEKVTLPHWIGDEEPTPAAQWLIRAANSTRVRPAWPANTQLPSFQPEAPVQTPGSLASRIAAFDKAAHQLTLIREHLPGAVPSWRKLAMAPALWEQSDKIIKELEQGATFPGFEVELTAFRDPETGQWSLIEVPVAPPLSSVSPEDREHVVTEFAKNLRSSAPQVESLAPYIPQWTALREPETGEPRTPRPGTDALLERVRRNELSLAEAAELIGNHLWQRPSDPTWERSLAAADRDLLELASQFEGANAWQFAATLHDQTAELERVHRLMPEGSAQTLTEICASMRGNLEIATEIAIPAARRRNSAVDTDNFQTCAAQLRAALTAIDDIVASPEFIAADGEKRAQLIKTAAINYQLVPRSVAVRSAVERATRAAYAERPTVADTSHANEIAQVWKDDVQITWDNPRAGIEFDGNNYDVALFDMDGTILEEQDYWPALAAELQTTPSVIELLRSENPDVGWGVIGRQLLGPNASDETYNQLLAGVRARLTAGLTELAEHDDVLDVAAEHCAAGKIPWLATSRNARQAVLIMASHPRSRAVFWPEFDQRAAAELLRRIDAGDPHALDAFPPNIITRDHVGEAGAKPDPAPYLLALERLGIPAARCVTFEDDVKGSTAAERAGIAVVNAVEFRRGTQSAEVPLSESDLAELRAQPSRLLGFLRAGGQLPPDDGDPARPPRRPGDAPTDSGRSPTEPIPVVSEHRQSPASGPTDRHAPRNHSHKARARLSDGPQRAATLRPPDRRAVATRRSHSERLAPRPGHRPT